MLFAEKIKLTDAQRQIYAMEKAHNFREIARLLCTRSKNTLTTSDIISEDSEERDEESVEPSTTVSGSTSDSTSKRLSTIQRRSPTSLASRLASWGEFAEIAHGDLDPAFLIREIETLSSPGYPYEGYTALSAPGVKCLGVFRGPGRMGIQGYVALRPGGSVREGEENARDEVLISFSGTCNVWQVFQDLDVRREAYPYPSTSPMGSRPPSKDVEGDDSRSDRREPLYNNPTRKPRVHKGFWRLYTAMRPLMKTQLSSALHQHPDADLVIVGHSLGAAMCYLLAMDILLNNPELRDEHSNGEDIYSLTEGRKITLAAFGCPRVGDSDLVQLLNEAAKEYRGKYGSDKFQEYSVKAFDDGAHCLPQHSFGYRHICQTPFYLYQGDLYRIPAGDTESSFFNVEPRNRGDGGVFPLGGHNYYNNRNMEKPVLCMQKLKLKTLGEDGWKERYQKIKSHF